MIDKTKLSVYECENTHFYYNLDLSGQMLIVCKNGAALEVNAQDVAKFVATVIIQAKINKLEHDRRNPFEALING